MQKITAAVTGITKDMRVLSTWFSTGTKLLGLAVILPIAIVKLTDIELNVWMLGLVAINIINLLEFSITPTTIRQLSYQKGMAAENRTDSMVTAAYTLHQTAALCVTLIACITIFSQLRLSDAGVVLSPLVWAIPLLLYFKVLNSFYAAILHANDRIPYHRMVEAAANIALTLLTIAILTVTTDVALLLCMQIIPQAAILPIIRKAARQYQKTEKFRVSSLIAHKADIITPTLNQVGASLLGFGTLQIVAIYINATNTIAYANTFLLSLRMIQSIATFTNPIFYTYIPQLARIYKSQGVGTLQTLARQKQRYTVIAFIVATQTITVALLAIPSAAFGLQDKLPDPEMWIVLSIAFTFYRIGATNLQTSALMGFVNFQTAEFAATLALLVQVGVLAIIWNYQNIPINLLLTYLIIYLPITIRLSRQSESQTK
ncbi:hypothetical protein [Pararhizobium sp. A13]|uniref:hypothetical protein n=1 Tax=Pararhizobium sp. A13 TaxID=3133975 RepID=UPI00311B0613